MVHGGAIATRVDVEVVDGADTAVARSLVTYRLSLART